MRRAGARKASARKASARKNSARKRSATPARKSTVSRVKRVTREVVQQATGAVSAGVETLRDLGEQLVDRVRA